MEDPLLLKTDPLPDALVFNEVQLLLADKRTSLSTMRTGIAVFAFPLSILSVLIVTSKAYNVSNVMHWLLPLLVINLGLLILGIYLVTHAVIRILRNDRRLDELKRKNKRVAELLG